MDNYIEQIVKREISFAQRMSLIGSLLVVIVGIVFMMFVKFNTGVLIIAIGAFLIYYCKFSEYTEYEYEFTNGDCSIDKIINMASRKSVYKFGVGEVDRVLEYNGEKFQNELETNSRLTVKHLDSGDDDNSDNWYVFMSSVKNQTVAVVLELNEKSLEHVKTFYKNKFE